jgi:hypothetical protein
MNELRASLSTPFKRQRGVIRQLLSGVKHSTSAKSGSVARMTSPNLIF